MLDSRTSTFYEEPVTADAGAAGLAFLSDILDRLISAVEPGRASGAYLVPQCLGEFDRGAEVLTSRLHVDDEDRRLGTLLLSGYWCRNATATVTTATAGDQGADDSTLARYHQLVELKYLAQATDADLTEMQALGQEIDRQHEDYYEPLLAELRARLADRHRDLDRKDA